MSLSDAIGWLCQVLGFLGLMALPAAVVLAFGGEARLLLLLAAVLLALPIVVILLQLALSRSREFDADLAAARLTGDPEGLACALEVLEWTTGRIWETPPRGPRPRARPAAAAHPPGDAGADPAAAPAQARRGRPLARRRPAGAPVRLSARRRPAAAALARHPLVTADQADDRPGTARIHLRG